MTFRRFVMAFHQFRTPILLVESLFEEVDSSLREFVSSSCQFDSSDFNSSFYELDSSLTESVRLRRLSFCRLMVSLWYFIVSTSIKISVTWLHAPSIYPYFCAILTENGLFEELLTPQRRIGNNNNNNNNFISLFNNNNNNFISSQWPLSVRLINTPLVM